MSCVRTTGTMSLDRGDLDEVVGIFRKFIADVQETTGAINRSPDGRGRRAAAVGRRWR